LWFQKQANTKILGFAGNVSSERLFEFMFKAK